MDLKVELGILGFTVWCLWGAVDAFMKGDRTKGLFWVKKAYEKNGAKFPDQGEKRQGMDGDGI